MRAICGFSGGAGVRNPPFRRLERCGFDPCVRRGPYPKWRLLDKFWKKKKKEKTPGEPRHKWWGAKTTISHMEPETKS